MKKRVGVRCFGTVWGAILLSSMFRAGAALALVLLGGASTASANTVDLGNFNPPPSLDAVDAASPEQRDLVSVAKTVQGDGREDAQLQACEDLLNDPSAPADVRRWADLRRIPLYAYIGQEWEALRIARDWVVRNPNSPVCLNVRIVAAYILADRRHAGFSPGPEEFLAAAEEIFSQHDPTAFPLIELRVRYGQKLVVEDSGMEGREACARQLDLAEEALLEIIRNPPTPPEGMTLVQRARWLEEHQNDGKRAVELLNGLVRPYRERVLHPERDPAIQAEIERGRQQFKEAYERDMANRETEQVTQGPLGE